jgi:hypothetical protein
MKGNMTARERDSQIEQRGGLKLHNSWCIPDPTTAIPFMLLVATMVIKSVGLSLPNQ